MSTFEDIDKEINTHEIQISELRAAGARAAADLGMPGAEIMKWLKGHGATDTAARRLCVAIIHERRDAAKATDAQP